MLTRLREAHDQATLAEMYATPHRHALYGADHAIRVGQTAALVDHVVRWSGAVTVADLSCGDGAVVQRALAGSLGEHVAILGDIAPGWPIEGPIEATLVDLDRVDLFVCCETLEHLDDPAAVLAQIRDKALRLVASLPLAQDPPDDNPEHYWQIDTPADGEALLAAAGWTVEALVEVSGPRGIDWPYRYLVWSCT